MPHAAEQPQNFNDLHWSLRRRAR